MSTCTVLKVFSLLGAFALVASPVLACERHQTHTASSAEASATRVTTAQPPQAAAPALSQSSAAAITFSQALSSEPVDRRCSRMQKIEQALTQ